MVLNSLFTNNFGSRFLSGFGPGIVGGTGGVAGGIVNLMSGLGSSSIGGGCCGFSNNGHGSGSGGGLAGLTGGLLSAGLATTFAAAALAATPPSKLSNSPLVSATNESLFHSTIIGPATNIVGPSSHHGANQSTSGLRRASLAVPGASLPKTLLSSRQDSTPSLPVGGELQQRRRRDSANKFQADPIRQAGSIAAINKGVMLTEIASPRSGQRRMSCSPTLGGQQQHQQQIFLMQLQSRSPTVHSANLLGGRTALSTLVDVEKGEPNVTDLEEEQASNFQSTEEQIKLKQRYKDNIF
ncbi:unnamed protein product [Protopolystoma xenopodis]|uniref:Uncharacterized protein n=1 Tax=Protopolystoma xenopodis TaxID=117903 RepID=A0A3S5B6Q4_9PLAT|nr:unnamed protein product [Protopolystoma xenopodis]